VNCLPRPNRLNLPGWKRKSRSFRLTRRVSNQWLRHGRQSRTPLPAASTSNGIRQLRSPERVNDFDTPGFGIWFLCGNRGCFRPGRAGCVAPVDRKAELRAGTAPTWLEGHRRDARPLLPSILAGCSGASKGVASLTERGPSGDILGFLLDGNVFSVDVCQKAIYIFAISLYG